MRTLLTAVLAGSAIGADNQVAGVIVTRGRGSAFDDQATAIPFDPEPPGRPLAQGWATAVHSSRRRR